jgi:hypothetical protein
MPLSWRKAKIPIPAASSEEFKFKTESRSMPGLHYDRDFF